MGRPRRRGPRCARAGARPRSGYAGGRRARPAGVVGRHEVGLDEPRRAVDEDERDTRVAVAQEVAVVAPCGDDHEPVDAAGEERLDEVALALGVLVGAAGEGEHPAGAGDFLDPAVHRRVERVRDVVEDQADARREPVGATQVRRGRVPAIPEHRDGPADLLGELGVDLRVFAQRPRDGTEAHARHRGHLAHRRTPPGRPVIRAACLRKRFAHCGRHDGLSRPAESSFLDNQGNFLTRTAPVSTVLPVERTFSQLGSSG